ncbi:MAG: Type 1 glutamine amidotransferase-like domain-containing protein [Sciscionella sp.]
MTAEEPTILATSGGWRAAVRRQLDFGPLIDFALELSGVDGRRPRLCYVGTACGDQQYFSSWVMEAGQASGIEVSLLNLFPMPPSADLDDFVGAADVVWVNGGSVANLLAVWRVHELDAVLHRAWQAGVVLGGISAGSLCWHAGGPTDSFGPELRIVTNTLGWLPYGNGVHYDTEPMRRPAVQDAVAGGVLPTTYCTDDGAGLYYRGTELVEAVSERRTGGAYVVRAEEDSVPVEHALNVRRL